MVQPRTFARLRASFILVPAALILWGLALWSWVAFSPSAGAASDDAFHDVHLELSVPYQGEWRTVLIDMFVHDDGTGSFDADAQAARDQIASRFPGAVAVGQNDVEAAYVLNGYWWTSGSTWWAYNDAAKPAGLSGELSSIAAGANVWGTVGANFAFSGGGTSTAGTGACQGGNLDGANTIGWAEQPGSVLAVTCTWFSSGNPGAATEFDMQIDPAWNWTTGSPVQIDLQSVAAHEFGHALGLGHTSTAGAVMYPSYSSGSIIRDPQPDDISGIIAIYGAQGVGATLTPTPTTAATNTPLPSPTAPNTPPATPGATGTPAGGGGGSTPSPTPTATKTPAPGGGNTPSPTVTATVTPTRTASPTATPTKTPTPKASPTPTKAPQPLPPSLAIVPGANFLAWPGGTAAPETALAGHGNVIEMVYSYDNATGTWTRYGPDLPGYVNNLHWLVTGNAYWFVASGSAVITAP